MARLQASQPPPSQRRASQPWRIWKIGTTPQRMACLTAPSGGKATAAAAHAVHSREDLGLAFSSLSPPFYNARASTAAIPAMDGAMPSLFPLTLPQRRGNPPCLIDLMLSPSRYLHVFYLRAPPSLARFVLYSSQFGPLPPLPRSNAPMCPVSSPVYFSLKRPHGVPG